MVEAENERASKIAVDVGFKPILMGMDIENDAKEIIRKTAAQTDELGIS